MAWQMDKRISAGNLLVALGMVASIIWGYSRLTVAAETLSEKTSWNVEQIQNNETRIRVLEALTARQDERLIMILDGMNKIETKLDKMAENNL